MFSNSLAKSNFRNKDQYELTSEQIEDYMEQSFDERYDNYEKLSKEQISQDFRRWDTIYCVFAGYDLFDREPVATFRSEEEAKAFSVAHSDMCDTCCTVVKMTFLFHADVR